MTAELTLKPHCGFSDWQDKLLNVGAPNILIKMIEICEASKKLKDSDSSLLSTSLSCESQLNCYQANMWFGNKMRRQLTLLHNLCTDRLAYLLLEFYWKKTTILAKVWNVKTKKRVAFTSLYNFVLHRAEHVQGLPNFSGLNHPQKHQQTSEAHPKSHFVLDACVLYMI